MGDESVWRTVWKAATWPVRLMLVGLLWVFAADGSPLRVGAFLLGLYVFLQLVQYLTSGDTVGFRFT